MAPHRYQVSTEGDPKLLGNELQNTSQTLKNPKLPLRIPWRASVMGKANITASFTFVYCREDNTGVCRIKTLRWSVPVELTFDSNAPAEVNLNARVVAD